MKLKGKKQLPNSIKGISYLTLHITQLCPTLGCQRKVAQIQRVLDEIEDSDRDLGGYRIEFVVYSDMNIEEVMLTLLKFQFLSNFSDKRGRE